jgi:predicted metal-binding membrane protein
MIASEARTPLHRPLVQFIWRHPESWAIALSAAAWLVLLRRALLATHSHGALASWLHWMLMVGAMMIPLTVDAIQTSATRSLWRRRHRAILLFLAGYSAVWAAIGLPLAWFSDAVDLPARLPWTYGAAFGFLAAAAWMLTRWKPLTAQLCHRTLPLAPVGWRADRDCLRYGWHSGGYCLLNCWPFMLVCWLSAHSFVAMTAGFAFGWADRYRRPAYRTYAWGLVAVAVAFAGYERWLGQG